MVDTSFLSQPYQPNALGDLQAITTGQNFLNAQQTQKDVQSAGARAASGDYSGATSQLLAQGHIPEANSMLGWQNLDQKRQAGALAASNRLDDASALLYKAGLFPEADMMREHMLAANDIVAKNTALTYSKLYNAAAAAKDPTTGETDPVMWNGLLNGMRQAGMDAATVAKFADPKIGPALAGALATKTEEWNKQRLDQQKANVEAYKAGTQFIGQTPPQPAAPPASGAPAATPPAAPGSPSPAVPVPSVGGWPAANVPVQASSPATSAPGAPPAQDQAAPPATPIVPGAPVPAVAPTRAASPAIPASPAQANAAAAQAATEQGQTITRVMPDGFGGMKSINIDLPPGTALLNSKGATGGGSAQERLIKQFQDSFEGQYGQKLAPELAAKALKYGTVPILDESNKPFVPEKATAQEANAIAYQRAWAQAHPDEPPLPKQEAMRAAGIVEKNYTGTDIGFKPDENGIPRLNTSGTPGTRAYALTPEGAYEIKASNVAADRDVNIKARNVLGDVIQQHKDTLEHIAQRPDFNQALIWSHTPDGALFWAGKLTNLEDVPRTAIDMKMTMKSLSHEYGNFVAAGHKGAMSEREGKDLQDIVGQLNRAPDSDTFVSSLGTLGELAGAFQKTRMLGPQHVPSAAERAGPGAPPAPPAPLAPSDSLANARAAIAQGAPREVVIDRLKKAHPEIDTSGL